MVTSIIARIMAKITIKMDIKKKHSHLYRLKRLDFLGTLHLRVFLFIQKVNAISSKNKSNNSIQ